jgi:hypothetical protein
MSRSTKRSPADKASRSLGRAEAMPRSRAGIATAGASLKLVGNQTVQAMLRRGLGGVADREEHAAEAFAGWAVGPSATAGDAIVPSSMAGRPAMRRAPAQGRSEAGAQLGLSGGQHLPRDIRAFFEPRLGRDLADVRVHTDARAAESVLSLRARAYASGSDIVFASGQYRPQTREGRRLIGHELAHVGQADRGDTRIRRDGGGPADDLAQQDAKLLEDVKNFPAYFTLNSAASRRGLAAWKTKYPLSFAELRTKVVNIIGEAAFERLLQQDGDILELVQKSQQIIEQLSKLQQEAEGQTAAQNVIDFYTGYIGKQGFYDFDYTYFAGVFKDDPRRDITPLKWLLSGSTQEIVQRVRDNASLAQSDEDALQAQRQTWKADGESVLGTTVAEKQRTLWWNAELHLQSLLAPEYGDEDPDVMLAIARMSGSTTAVLKVKARYYAYKLDKDYNREDIFLLPDKDTYVEVLPAGPLAGAVYALTVSGGFVLRPPVGGGELYRSGDETENPLKRLEADTKLLESGKAKEVGLAPIDVFQSMLSNLALLNLKNAEERLKEIRRSSQNQGVFQPTPDPAAGDRLKRDAARLQSVMIELNSLAAEIEDKEPTDEQNDRRDALLTESGQIVSNNPGAALFVRNKRDPDSNEPAEESDVENTLGNKSGAEAAQAAMSEVDKRLDNIAQVRRAIFDDPSRVLDFDVLYEPVLARFNEGEKSSIKTSLFLHSLDKFASIVRISAIDLGLLLAGFITGGETWIGLAVHGTGLGLGLYQLRGQAAEASLLSAESELDVEGGFQLATRDQARSARNWLLISVGLNALAVFGFSRALRTFLQESSRKATLLSRFAARVGVTEEVMAAALRKNWLGIADPDPAALQKILLSSLDPELARQFENRTIIKVLSDAEWLKKYPNSAAHAKLQMLSGGPNPELVVEFRKSGSILSLEEEAQHIQQATDPNWAGKIMATQEAAKSWGTMSNAAKLQAWRDTLEIEIDVQKRLLQRAQLVGDTEAMDDAFGHVEDLSSQLGDVNEALADPAKAPAWFDPAHPPGVFSTPRLPRTGGKWGADGKGRPGNSVWYPDNDDVTRVIGKGNGIRFRNGYPDFEPWSVGRVNLGEMSGEADDFAEADKLFAQGVMNRTRKPPPGFTREDFIYRGAPKAQAAKLYRQSAGLTWHHHQGGKLMLLVPTDLHANVPHTGGASGARAAL